MKLVEYARELGYEVVDLYNDGTPPARLIAFEPELEKKPDILICAGHGNKCYSQDTEILTENGWKYFYELKETEAVATLSSNGELEYQIPTSFFSSYYSGKMFLIDGSCVNLLVTPNHNLYASWMVHGGSYSPFQLLEARHIGKHGLTRDPLTGTFLRTGFTTGYCLRFTRTAKWHCQTVATFAVPSTVAYHKNPIRKPETRNSINIPIEKWLRFFGIWLAEGSASLGDSGAYIISITQNNDEKRAIIKQYVHALEEMFGFSSWEEKSNSHSKAIKFKNKQIYDYLHQFGHAGDKFVPKEIKMLEPHLLQVLFDAMVLGDGNINSYGEVFYSTKSKRLADDVQEIALKIGKAGTIWRTKKQIFTVGIRDGDVFATKRSQHWIDYDGMVYCLEVPSHLLYVRRHGKPCWCGNSIMTGMDLEVLIKQGVNDDLTSGVKTLFWACETAASLGPSMVEKSCPEFYGYGADWCFVYHPDFKGKPLEDPYARGFFDAGLTTGYGLLAGKAPKQIFDETVAKYDYWWDYWVKQNDPLADDCLTWLNWDKTNFMAITKDGLYADAQSRVNWSGLLVPAGLAGAALVFLLTRKGDEHAD